MSKDRHVRSILPLAEEFDAAVKLDSPQVMLAHYEHCLKAKCKHMAARAKRHLQVMLQERKEHKHEEAVDICGDL